MTMGARKFCFKMTEPSGLQLVEILITYLGDEKELYMINSAFIRIKFKDFKSIGGFK